MHVCSWRGGDRGRGCQWWHLGFGGAGGMVVGLVSWPVSVGGERVHEVAISGDDGCF